MPQGLKILLTILLICLQLAIIVAGFRAKMSTLMKLGFLHFRGESMSRHLRETGAEIRREPEQWRALANLSIVCLTLPLDGLVAAVWLE